MNYIENNNDLHPSVRIGENVILGKFNTIGKNVVIDGFKGEKGTIIIGDCNVIHDNTRILAGEGGITIGDWNVLHNNMLVMGEEEMNIGHNCWFGQNTILDSSGGLFIGNGVRVGMYSQIWTHVASGELIEGCTLFGKRKTIIEDEVWLVGSCIVSSGVKIGKRSICLIGSNITKDVIAGKVYAGSPAIPKENLNFYEEKTLLEKFHLMIKWVREFANEKENIKLEIDELKIEISDLLKEERILIVQDLPLNETNNISVFVLNSKTYTKKLTSLERNFYKFIYGYRARFTPTIR